MSLLIPGKSSVLDVGPKKYETYGPINVHQFMEIKRQICEGLMMGVPPEQPVSMPTIAVVGLLRFVDELLAPDSGNNYEFEIEEEPEEPSNDDK